MPLESIAETRDINEYDGNDWRSWNYNRKMNFIAGFIAGSGHVTTKSHTYLHTTSPLMLLPSSINEKKADDLWREVMSILMQKKKTYKADDVKLIVYIEIKRMQDFLSDYSIPNITSGQIADGLDILYEDFKNRNILLVDAVYVIKRQITGSPPEDIERILLYLRSNRKEYKHLQVEDEKGKIIRIISFP